MAVPSGITPIFSPSFQASGRPATPPRTLHASNSWKSNGSGYLSKYTRHNYLEPPNTRKSDVDYMFKSHATMFAQVGVDDTKRKHYNRCPITGTWFLDQPYRRRDYHDTKSTLSMRLTESADIKPGSKPHTVWAAPCAANYWIDKVPDKPSSMVINSSHVEGLLAAPINRSSSTPNMRRR